MRRSSKNHRENETLRIANLSNAKLLEETLDLAQGDDYDGCFTRDGEVTFELLKNELTRRLENWLDQ